MKIDNEKLAEIVREKDNEIAKLLKTLRQKEPLSGRSTSVEGASDPAARLQQYGSSQRDQSELKAYYETELKDLYKQMRNIQKILTTNVNTEDKIYLLQTEMQSIKELSFKKVQTLENKLKALNAQTNRQVSPIKPIRMSTEPSENTDPKFQPLSSFQSTANTQRPITSCQPTRKQSVVETIDTRKQSTAEVITRKQSTSEADTRKQSVADIDFHK